MATALQTIQKLVRSLDRSTAPNGLKALDTAIRACSGYSSTQELVNEFVSKCYAMRGASNSAINQFLKLNCGIDLDSNNNDTGAISGRDANGGDIKTADSIVYEQRYSSVGLIDSKYYGKTYKFSDIDNRYMVTATLPTLVRGTEQERMVITGLANWWIPQAASLVKDTYGLYFNKRQDSTDYITPRIDFYLYYDSNDSALAKTWSPSSRQNFVRIGINMSHFTEFSIINKKDGNVSGYRENNNSQHMDRILAHEMTHAMFDLNVMPRVRATLPRFFSEGIAELVHGADERKGEMYSLIRGDEYIFAALSLSNTQDSTTYCYAAGYMLLRYLAQQVKTGARPPIIAGLKHSADNTMLTVTTAFNGSTIDTYKAEVETIDAKKAKRAVSIIGNNLDNTIYANNKGNFLRGGYGNDTLYGGTGVDTFFSFGVEGNDTIYNYQSGRDIIWFGSANYGALTSATVEGSDVVLKVGNGSVTIKDGAGKYIKIKDGNENVSYNRFLSGTSTYNSGTVSFETSSNSEAYTLYQKSLPGLVYNSNKTALTAKKDYNGYTINTNEFWWTVKSVNLAAVNNVEKDADQNGFKVYGNESVTSMTGSKYNDTFIAGGRSAVMKGGAGNDELFGASVSSKLYGGTGNDQLYGQSGTNYLYGEAGDDTLSTLLCISGKSYLYGGEGNDKLYAGEGTNLLEGGNGDDELLGGKGTNTLNGGNGNDKLYGAQGANTVNKLNGGNGNDTILGGEGKNTLNGGNGDDELYGGKGENTINNLNGGNGHDILKGGEGTNTLRGGNGNDTLTGGSGTNLLYGDAGNDTITGGSGLSKLYGGVGNDFLTGGSDINELYGGAGNDELHGGQDTNGSYLLKGEAGSDTIVGGAGYNTLWGGAGKDTLTGGTGENTYYFASLGEMAGDTITNLKDNDVLYFNLKKTALDLDAIYQNYNLGRTTGKNTISLEGETLTITDKTNHKYRMNLAGGYNGNITLQNNSQQQQSFKF